MCQWTRLESKLDTMSSHMIGSRMLLQSKTVIISKERVKKVGYSVSPQVQENGKSKDYDDI